MNFPEKFDAEAEIAVQKIADALRERGATLACAESCTGGLLAGALTEIAGASAFFRGGAVTYATDTKTRVIGVPAEITACYGVVSAECAEAMARGAAETFGADFALSTTGVAGPTGGSAAAPVGTVFLGLRTPNGVRSRRFLPISRERKTPTATRRRKAPPATRERAREFAVRRCSPPSPSSQKRSEHVPAGKTHAEPQKTQNGKIFKKKSPHCDRAARPPESPRTPRLRVKNSPEKSLQTSLPSEPPSKNFPHSSKAESLADYSTGQRPVFIGNKTDMAVRLSEPRLPVPRPRNKKTVPLDKGERARKLCFAKRRGKGVLPRRIPSAIPPSDLLNLPVNPNLCGLCASA